MGSVDGPDDITPVWLTAALKSGGGLRSGHVVSFETIPMGLDRGFAGRVVRLRPTYRDANPEAPLSLVAKFAAEPGSTRTLAERFQLYRREALFYQELAQQCPVPTARAYYSSGGGAESVLLLEDLEAGQEIDLREGCSLDQAAAIVRLLAKLHARFWNDVGLTSHRWLPTPNDQVVLDIMNESSERSWESFRRGRMGAGLPWPLVTLGNRVAADRTVHDRLSSPPWTLVHADMRAHNIIFDAADGVTPIAVIDWQTAVRARGPLDLASLFVSSLQVRDRRVAEAELLPAYHGELLRRGITGYSYNECWRDYCLGAINQFSQVIALSGLIEVQTKVRDDLAVPMGERLTAALVDLKLTDLVPPTSWLDGFMSTLRRSTPQPVRRMLRAAIR